MSSERDREKGKEAVGMNLVVVRIEAVVARAKERRNICWQLEEDKL